MQGIPKGLKQGRIVRPIPREVHWEDVDGITFTSFWEYAYTGNYDIPEPEPPVVPEHPTPTSPPETEEVPVAEPELISEQVADIQLPVESESWGVDWGTPSKKKKARKSYKEILQDFEKSWSDDLPVPVNHHSYDSESMPKSFGEFVVHHAKVYILADRYGVIQLMNISFEKLRQALVGCDTEEVPQRLQQMVAHYAACKVEKLWKDEDFQDLLEASGSFSRLLVGKVTLRL
ncbi:hypothetical protein S7711_10047 [Stachybotrys chartarum IBT 7711]|uniref:BTB domain-containing protein n=1 Tax=Stachybotrys chartarum (strain CBS 109288 / IBT 7711) TaxID=1280523 RepID=A0A084B877_STACB|nr:hypothetical protein S7711_10047 [Stachybotrys chartarum IBT 7711]